VLTVARGGPKLTSSKDDEKLALNVTGNPAAQASDRIIIGRKASVAQLAWLLGLRNATGRPVLDRTGLMGEFSFQVKFAPVDNNAFGNTSSASLFTALKEHKELGRKSC
jgi:uncharacterized protein (TIGR03435 family)